MVFGSRSRNSESRDTYCIRAESQGNFGDMKFGRNTLRGEEYIESKPFESGLSSSISLGRSLPSSSDRPAVVSVKSLLNSEDSRQQSAEIVNSAAVSSSDEKTVLAKEEAQTKAGGVDRNKRGHEFSSEWVTEWSIHQGWRKLPDSRNLLSEASEQSRKSLVPGAAALRKSNEERPVLDSILQKGKALGKQRRSPEVELFEEYARVRMTEDYLSSSSMSYGAGSMPDNAAERSSGAGGSPSTFWRQKGHSEGRDSRDIQAGSTGQFSSLGTERGGGPDARSVAELIRRFREGPPSRRGEREFPSSATFEKADFQLIEEERRREGMPADMTDEEVFWESLYYSEEELGPGKHLPPSRGYRGNRLSGAESEFVRSRIHQHGGGGGASGRHYVNGGRSSREWLNGGGGENDPMSIYNVGGMRERTHTVNGDVAITLAPVRRLLWPQEEKPNDSFAASRGASGLPQVDGQVSGDGDASPAAGSSPLQFDEEDILEKWRRKRAGAAITAENSDSEAELAALHLALERNGPESDNDLSADESEFLHKVRQRLGLVTIDLHPLNNRSDPRNCPKSPRTAPHPARPQPPHWRDPSPPSDHLTPTNPTPWPATTDTTTTTNNSNIRVALSPERPFGSSPPTGRSPLGRNPASPPVSFSSPHESPSLASRRGFHPAHLKLSQDASPETQHVAHAHNTRPGGSSGVSSRPFGAFSPPRPKARPTVSCHARSLMSNISINHGGDDSSRSSPSPSSSPGGPSPSFPSPPDSPVLSPPPIVTLPRHLARAAPVTIETPFPPGLRNLTCRVSSSSSSSLSPGFESPPRNSAGVVGSPTRGGMRRRGGGGGEGVWDVDLRRALLSLGDPKRDPTTKAPRKTTPAVSAMISETVDDWLLGDEFPTCSWGMDAPDVDIEEPAAALPTTEPSADPEPTNGSSPPVGASAPPSANPLEQQVALNPTTPEIVEPADMEESKQALIGTVEVQAIGLTVAASVSAGNQCDGPDPMSDEESEDPSEDFSGNSQLRSNPVGNVGMGVGEETLSLVERGGMEEEREKDEGLEEERHNISGMMLEERGKVLAEGLKEAREKVSVENLREDREEGSEEISEDVREKVFVESLEERRERVFEESSEEERVCETGCDCGGSAGEEVRGRFGVVLGGGGLQGEVKQEEVSGVVDSLLAAREAVPEVGRKGGVDGAVVRKGMGISQTGAEGA